MNRRISQALAIRSTNTPLRVTHVVRLAHRRPDDLRAPLFDQHRLDFFVRHSLDEIHLADHRGAAVGLDLLAEPLKILECLVRIRQNVYSLLERVCPESPQPPPNPHSQVAGRRWKLMNQNEPSRARR
jgi:hypothetical protein